MEWTAGRLARYAQWSTRRRYNDLRRRVSVAYARIAYWLPVGDPDFIGIGAARTASTWLYNRLSLHPDVCLSKKKEIHFFDVQEGEGRWVYGPDAIGPSLSQLDIENPYHWRWYRSQFGHCKAGLIGEFTPDYSLLGTDRIAIVKEHLPNLKLIYVLRDPITRAWSSVRKELWWRFRMRPHELHCPETLLRMSMRPGILARGDYMSTILRWETHYQGRLLYLFYDDIIASPRNALYQVCNFLGLDRSPFDTTHDHATRVNEAPNDDIPNEIRVALENFYAPQYPFLKEKFGHSLPNWFAAPQRPTPRSS